MAYVYGLTPTDVRDYELSFEQDLDTVLLTDSIDRAAGDLNAELRALGIEPEDITQADYPDDWTWCRSTVSFGAAGLYLRSVTGSEQAATTKLEMFSRRIRSFIARPQMLKSYPATASAALTARGPSNYGDPQGTTRARSRMLDPSRVSRWRQ